MEDPFDVGFTGTRGNLTTFQQKRLLELLVYLRSQGAVGFHHGDCVGADAISHYSAIRAGFEHIVIHPPTDTKAQAHCTTAPPKGIVFREPKPYLTRNHDIVNETSVLIACPKGPEVVRSGTWATVRHARKSGNGLYILLPFSLDIGLDPFDWQPSEKLSTTWAHPQNKEK